MKKEPIICISILVLLPLLLYWQTIHFEFVWDDITFHLQLNPYLQKFTWDSLVKIWSRIYVGMYIPLTYTVWGFLKPIGQLFSNTDQGFHGGVYHIANVLIHILNGLLVYKILIKMVPNRWSCLLGALFFLLHPIQNETVAWVSELRGLLSCLLGLLAFNLYLEKKWRYLPLIPFIFAALAKPSIVVLPCFILIHDILLDQKKISQALKNIIPWIAIAIPIVVITKIAQPFSTKVVETAIFNRPFIWTDAIDFYLQKIIFPINLTSLYPRSPQRVLQTIWPYISWVIPAALSLLLWSIRRKHKILCVAFAFFIAGFLPVSGLINFNFQNWSTVADRYIYLSMFGFALAIAHIFDKFKHLFIKVAIIILLGFYFYQGYFVQIPTWRNSITLWDHCLEIYPEESLAYNNRGDGYNRIKNFSQALKDFDTAVRLDPAYVEAYANRGSALNNLGRYDEAAADLDKAIELDPQKYWSI